MTLRPAAALTQRRQPPRDAVRESWLELRRGVARRRRLLAAACAGIAVIAALSAVTANPPARTTIIAAARDLPAGAVLTGNDLRAVALPAAATPAGALTAASSAIGRTTSGALRRGEPITDVRLADGPLAPPSKGLVAVPVRLADAQAAQLLETGERVDVLAASTATEPGQAPDSAQVVASGVSVVAIPTAPAPAGTATDPDVEGALVVLATTTDQARALAQAEVSSRLSAIVIG